MEDSVRKIKCKNCLTVCLYSGATCVVLYNSARQTYNLITGFLRKVQAEIDTSGLAIDSTGVSLEFSVF